MNNTTYTIELSEEGIKNYIKTLEKIEKAFSSDDFHKYLLDKCRELLTLIIEKENVSEIERAGEYLEGCQDEIGKGYIYLYNDSTIDIPSSDTFFSDYAKQFYPIELSLAELVEYGTGLVGAESSKNTGDEWEYMANPKRDYREGWEWKNGTHAVHTMGQEGKYIYFQLKEEIEKNIDKWVNDYFINLIGGSL